jgi:hypothetical protein
MTAKVKPEDYEVPMTKRDVNIRLKENLDKEGKGAAGKTSQEMKKKTKKIFKDGKGTDFGMLSVKAGIDKNPKPTKADRIAGATMKDGSRTKVRGVRIANKGFRKARMS